MYGSSPNESNIVLKRSDSICILCPGLCRIRTSLRENESAEPLGFCSGGEVLSTNEASSSENKEFFSKAGSSLPLGGIICMVSYGKARGSNGCSSKAS